MVFKRNGIIASFGTGLLFGVLVEGYDLGYVFSYCHTFMVVHYLIYRLSPGICYAFYFSTGRVNILLL